ncbi:unnamed protein product [Amoebophrya sp. A120]|nr:unnamed protein product [Amoebophrya sp. A120]|eukprot:GSA120T00001308001.1
MATTMLIGDVLPDGSVQLRQTSEVLQNLPGQEKFSPADIVAVSRELKTRAVSAVYKCFLPSEEIMTQMNVDQPLRFPERIGEILTDENDAEDVKIKAFALDGSGQEELVDFSQQAATFNFYNCPEAEQSTPKCSASSADGEVLASSQQQQQFFKTGSEIAFDVCPITKTTVTGPVWVRIDVVPEAAPVQQVGAETGSSRTANATSSSKPSPSNDSNQQLSCRSTVASDQSPSIDGDHHGSLQTENLADVTMEPVHPDFSCGNSTSSNTDDPRRNTNNNQGSGAFDNNLGPNTPQHQQNNNFQRTAAEMNNTSPSPRAPVTEVISLLSPKQQASVQQKQLQRTASKPKNEMILDPRIPCDAHERLQEQKRKQELLAAKNKAAQERLQKMQQINQNQANNDQHQAEDQAQMMQRTLSHHLKPPPSPPKPAPENDPRIPADAKPGYEPPAFLEDDRIPEDAKKQFPRTNSNSTMSTTTNTGGPLNNSTANKFEATTSSTTPFVMQRTVSATSAASSFSAVSTSQNKPPITRCMTSASGGDNGGEPILPSSIGNGGTGNGDIWGGGAPGGGGEDPEHSGNKEGSKEDSFSGNPLAKGAALDPLWHPEMHVGKVTNVGENDMTIVTVDERTCTLDDPVLCRSGLLPGMWVGFAIRDEMFVETEQERVYIMCQTMDDEPAPTHFPRVWGKIKTVTPTGHSFVDPDDREALAGTGKTEIFVHNDKGKKTNDRGGLVTADIVVVDVDRSNPHDPSVKGPIFKAIIEDSLSRKDGGTLAAALGMKGGKGFMTKDGKMGKGGLVVGKDKDGNPLFKGKDAKGKGKWNNGIDYQIYIGYIHEMDEGKHHGFVRSKPISSQYPGKDAYLYAAEIKKANLDKGDVIAFHVLESRDGKPTVSGRDPIYVLAAHKDDSQQLRFGDNEGFVSNHSKQNDLFVHNEDLRTQFGKDVFMHSKMAQEAMLQKGDTIVFKLFQTEDGRPQVSTPIWVKIGPDDELGERKFKQPPEQPFLPERAERLANPKGGKANTKGWEQWAPQNKGSSFKGGKKSGMHHKGGGSKHHDRDDHHFGGGMSKGSYHERHFGGDGAFGAFGGSRGGSDHFAGGGGHHRGDHDSHYGGGSSYKGGSSGNNRSSDFFFQDLDGPDLKRQRSDRYGGGSSSGDSFWGGSGTSGNGTNGGGGASFLDSFGGGSSHGHQQSSYHHSSPPQRQAASSPMSAPSADGSVEQKRQWFAHVYQQYVESYRQQGHDEGSARNMAQKSLEQYKQQCKQQGISVD